MSQVGRDFGQWSGHGPLPPNFEIIAACMDMVDKALARIPFEAGDSPFVIVDYGTANGLVSLGLMKHCIEWVKDQYGDEQAVCIIYEDQPKNDFNKLFENVLGKSSFVHHYRNVSIMASATNFFSRCVPRRSVHIGFSSMAMHNLSKKPCILKDTLLYILSDNANEREAFQKQGAEDWEKLLLCRAEELVPGGQFVASIPGVVDGGYVQYQPTTHKKNTIERLSHFWRVMKNNRTITQDEYQKASFSFYFRDKSLFEAPFLKADSIVPLSRLSLVGIKAATTKSPSPELSFGPEIRDRETCGKRFSGVVRSYTEGVFREALSDERLEEEKEAVLWDLYATLAEDVALSPSEYNMAQPHYMLHVEKEK